MERTSSIISTLSGVDGLFFLFETCIYYILEKAVEASRSNWGLELIVMT